MYMIKRPAQVVKFREQVMNNRITPIDDIRVEIYENGRKVDAMQGAGFHTVEEAIRNAYEGSLQENPIEDYVFSVENLSTGSMARYRLTAGGELRILPEKRG